MLLRNRYAFSAAHHLPQHAGACRRLHGHNYEVEVVLQGPVDATTGMVMDFAELDQLVQSQAIDPLDHRELNAILPNPTAEHIALWIWRRLAPALPALHEVTVFETPTCAVTYRGEHES